MKLKKRWEQLTKKRRKKRWEQRLLKRTFLGHLQVSRMKLLLQQIHRQSKHPVYNMKTEKCFQASYINVKTNTKSEERDLQYRLCHEYFGPEYRENKRISLVSRVNHWKKMQDKQPKKHLFIIVVSIGSVVKCLAQIIGQSCNIVIPVFLIAIPCSIL